MKEFLDLVNEYDDYSRTPLDYLEDMRGRGHGEREARAVIEDAIATHKVSYDERRRRVGRAEPDLVPQIRRKHRPRKS